MNPCCGSGHMLTRAFDPLYIVCEEEGGMRPSIRSEYGSQTVRAEDLTLTCSLSRYERRPLICSGLFRFCHSSALYSVDRSPGLIV